MSQSPESSTETGPVVLITGSASGIGLALALKLAKYPYRVIATARQQSLERLLTAGFRETERLLIRPLDVTDGADRRAVLAEIELRWGGVDILVNNAGISYRSVTEHVEEDEEAHQFAVNYFGPMALIRAVLPRMVERRRGRIINVSSVGGMMAMPTMGLYSASKFALEGASEALWYEMRPWNVHVSLVEPGFIHSNAFKHVYITRRGQEALRTEDLYRIYYESMGDFVARLMRRSVATPDTVAAVILRAMESRDPPLRLAGTPDAHLFSLLRRLLPRRLYHWVLYRNLPNVNQWARR